MSNHQDTAITAEQINKFELLIKDRLADFSIVSFSETETYNASQWIS